VLELDRLLTDDIEEVELLDKLLGLLTLLTEDVLELETLEILLGLLILLVLEED